MLPCTQKVRGAMARLIETETEIGSISGDVPNRLTSEWYEHRRELLYLIIRGVNGFDPDEDDDDGLD